MTASYAACWTRFMRHRQGIPHSPTATFDETTVLSVTPEDICRFFNSLAYGKEEPTVGDHPTSARSSTLEFYKKAISSFMPRRMLPWDDVRREGNPTRSVHVNTLIKTMKKFEVRQQGVKSAARRPLEYDEFVSLLSFLRQDDDVMRRQRLVAVLVTQWQLIGRIDDMMKMKYNNLAHNIQHNFTVFAQLRWSKNITEEREAPQQILLGSMDERVCVLVNLGIFLELQSESQHYTVDDFVFDGGDRSVRGSLAKAFASDRFAR